LVAMTMTTGRRRSRARGREMKRKFLGGRTMTADGSAGPRDQARRADCRPPGTCELLILAVAHPCKRYSVAIVRTCSVNDGAQEKYTVKQVYSDWRRGHRNLTILSTTYLWLSRSVGCRRMHRVCRSKGRDTWQYSGEVLQQSRCSALHLLRVT
jgi:hypothetical protein